MKFCYERFFFLEDCFNSTGYANDDRLLGELTVIFLYLLQMRIFERSKPKERKVGISNRKIKTLS